MNKFFFTMLMLFACSGNASVMLNDLSITSSNLSFNVQGTISQKGTSYQQQLMFGLVDNDDDWIYNLNTSASSFTEGSTNSRSISYIYSLSGIWTDSILTVGEIWQLGDIVDISFNFEGGFNVENFDPNNFGMSVGLNGNGNIVPSELNLVTSNVSVPEPSALALLGLGLFGAGFLRKKKSL